MLPIRDLNPTRRKPYVTWALIAINVAVFFLVQPRAFTGLDVDPTDNQTQNRFLYEHALVPCELSHLHVLTPSEVAECSGDARVVPSDTAFYPGKSVYLSLLASLFFHANLIHLLGNMWFLWIFGDNVEDDLGPIRYLTFYLVCGVLASLAHVFSTFAFGGNPYIPSLGASGAISGVLGGYIVLHPYLRVRIIIGRMLTEVPAIVAIGLWFVFQLVESLGVLGGMQIGGVAYAAHIGGFIAGMVLIKIFAIGRSRKVT